MKSACLFILAGLTLGVGVSAAQSPRQDLDNACLELLEKGERLTGTLDRDVYALGVEKLRTAARVCDSKDVSPELRARALILATRLHSDDRMLQLKMRTEALALLRAEAPDSRLLPKALEAVADIRFLIGDYDEGLSLSFQALEERERLFGTESREYVRGLVWVSVAYKGRAQLGDSGADLAMALKYSEQAVELARGLFGAHDPSTIGASMDLVDTLNRLHRFEEAKELQEKIAPFVDLADNFD
jgi:tetratricopeptide (TPR) repeat protein